MSVRSRRLWAAWSTPSGVSVMRSIRPVRESRVRVMLTTHQFLSDRAESARRVAFRGLGVGGRVAGGIATVAAATAEDVRGRVPGQHREQREGLALLTATMLDVRGANLTDPAAAGGRACATSGSAGSRATR